MSISLDEDQPGAREASLDPVEADVARLRELRSIIAGMSPEGREIVAGLLRERPSVDPTTPPAGRRGTFGVFAGQFSVGPEFFEPLPEEELRAWGET